MPKNTGSVLADHYIAIGREEKASAIRTWLEAVRASLTEEKNRLRAKVNNGEVQYQAELSETYGGIAIIGVLLDRMNEASDAAPAEVVQKDGFCSCWSDGTLAKDCGIAAHREEAGE